MDACLSYLVPNLDGWWTMTLSPSKNSFLCRCVPRFHYLTLKDWHVINSLIFLVNYTNFDFTYVTRCSSATDNQLDQCHRWYFLSFWCYNKGSWVLDWANFTLVGCNFSILKKRNQLKHHCNLLQSMILIQQNMKFRLPYGSNFCCLVAIFLHL